MTTLARAERIERSILVIRDQKVMLDSDLAELYGVTIKRLNQQVKRNRDRFPEDFMFQLTADEKAEVVAKNPHLQCLKFSPVLPYALTEPGAGMLASVLRGPTAAKVAVEVLRAFARLRQDEDGELPRSPYERRIRSLFAAIRDAVLLLPGDQRYTMDVPYTYFVQFGPDGPIKIGSTRNLLVRLRALSAACPVPLRLLGVIRDNVEERCHFQLAAFRIRGEWFAPGPAILNFIRERAITPNLEGHK